MHLQNSWIISTCLFGERGNQKFCGGWYVRGTRLEALVTFQLWLYADQHV